MMQAKLLEETGVVAEGIQRRQTYGRFIDRNRVFARPQAVDDITTPLLVKISRLEAELGKEKERNGDLERRISLLRNQIDREGIVPNFVPIRHVPVETVQADFLERLQRYDYRVEDALITRDVLLSPHRRTRGYVIPRHICVWLGRRICPQASLTKLGYAFKMDHTSCMHAIKRAPHWMAEMPFWSDLAKEVLEAFGAGDSDGSMQ